MTINVTEISEPTTAIFANLFPAKKLWIFKTGENGKLGERLNCCQHTTLSGGECRNCGLTLDFDEGDR